MEDTDIKNAVFDFFSGRATPIQKQAVNEWLADVSNHDQYYRWLQEWELAHLQGTASWEEAFSRTQRQVDSISASEGLPFSPVLKRSGIWKLFPYRAAAVILFCTSLALYSVRDLIFFQTEKSAYGETRQTVLPDGSVVSLNANSSIRYPRFGFANGRRHVELSGEADFEIRKTADRQPFVVSTATGLRVNVLGTEFTVFARPRGSRVTLRTGKVTLQTNEKTGRRAIIMSPGDIVAINTEGKMSRSHTAKPEDYSSWKDRMITLDRTSLQEISTILEEIYGFRVELNEEGLRERTATGFLPVQNAETALELVSDMFDIHFTHENNIVIFKN